MRVLVTGANGLVGRALRSVLDEADYQLIRTVRTSTTPWETPVSDLNESTDWGDALCPGVDAARVKLVAT